MRNKEEKDWYNQQLLEDKMHSEQQNEAQKQWRNVQRQDLASQYEMQMDRKRAMKDLEKQEERMFADEFKKRVNQYEDQHNKGLQDHR